MKKQNRIVAFLGMLREMLPNKLQKGKGGLDWFYEPLAPIDPSPDNPDADLYDSPPPPYGPDRQPESREHAHARRVLNARRIADWKRRSGGRPIYERIAEEVRHGSYKRRRHTYRGRVQEQMLEVALEEKFLERWLKTHRPRPSQKPARERGRGWRKANGNKPPHRPPEHSRPPPDARRRPNGRRNGSH